MGRSRTVTVYAEVETDVDIRIDEFLESCDDRDIAEVIDWLEKEDHLSPAMHTESADVTVHHKSFNESLSKISSNYYLLTKEEQEFIELIANKY